MGSPGVSGRGVSAPVTVTFSLRVETAPAQGAETVKATQDFTIARGGPIPRPGEPLPGEGPGHGGAQAGQKPPSWEGSGAGDVAAALGSTEGNHILGSHFRPEGLEE